MMLDSLLRYLIESTFYLTCFLVIYRFILSGLTHFSWMRVSLLGGLILGLILPLITLPLNWHHLLPGAKSVDQPLNLSFLYGVSGQSQPDAGKVTSGKNLLNLRVIILDGLGIIYLSVLCYRMIQLVKKLLRIRYCIKNNPKVKKGRYWFIDLETAPPAFCFFNYIFLSKGLKSMEEEDLQRISSHEIIHAKQYHTVDILLIEIISALYWFNPLIRIFKEYLQEVHEYAADEKILKNRTMKQSYSNLLLRLTIDEKPPMLSSGLSAKQISRRIRMIEKPRSLPGHRILFLLLLPVALVMFMSFSYLENRSDISSVIPEQQSTQTTSARQLKVGKIEWVNNTIYTDDQLNRKLGIKSGNVYSRDYLNQRLWLEDDAVCGLYLDYGYLFFNAEVLEKPNDNGTMNLTITIYEGIRARIRQITIEGNGSIPEEDVLKKITFKSGDLFSRKKIINSVNAISKMDQFDRENIAVNPIPINDRSDEEFALVDIEFKLAER